MFQASRADNVPNKSMGIAPITVLTGTDHACLLVSESTNIDNEYVNPNKMSPNTPELTLLYTALSHLLASP